jgi:proteasome lid subunit RPN8/RPN11
VVLIQQTCSSVSVAFDDHSVAEFFDQQVDLGRRPTEFARIWIHTHPGNSAEPSLTDEETLARVFGSTDWAVMFILARGGQTYCRLEFHVGPRAAMEVDSQVDYQQPFAASDHTNWFVEYRNKVLQLGAGSDVENLVRTPRPPVTEPERCEAYTVAQRPDHVELVDDWDAEPAWEEYLSTYEDYAYENYD